MIHGIERRRIGTPQNKRWCQIGGASIFPWKATLCASSSWRRRVSSIPVVPSLGFSWATISFVRSSTRCTLSARTLARNSL
jgi:hypothetical protein